MPATATGLDRAMCRPDATAHDDCGEAGLGARIEHARAAARAWPPAERHFSLQLFDLARLKARLGWRWTAQRGRAVDMIEAGLAGDLTPCELRLDNGDTRYFVIRAGGDRREVERHGELLAADVTARLCGTIPGGAIIRVTTLPMDPDTALAGIARTPELLCRLEALAQGGAQGGPARQTDPQPGLCARFQPILQLRKRLVSAYRLTAQTGDGRSATAVEAALGEAIDEWALCQAVGLLQGSHHGREPALVLPVHYRTLAGMRSREHYAQLCRQLPQRSSRLLIFELVGLPEVLPQARVHELSGYLRPFCLALLVRLQRAAGDIGHLAGSGVRGVSLAVGTTGDPVDSAALATLAGMARLAGMRSMLVDVAAVPLCRAAQAAGIDHLSGDALMPPMAQPGRAIVVTRGG